MTDDLFVKKLIMDINYEYLMDSFNPKIKFFGTFSGK